MHVATGVARPSLVAVTSHPDGGSPSHDRPMRTLAARRPIIHDWSLPLILGLVIVTALTTALDRSAHAADPISGQSASKPPEADAAEREDADGERRGPPADVIYSATLTSEFWLPQSYNDEPGNVWSHAHGARLGLTWFIADGAMLVSGIGMRYTHFGFTDTSPRDPFFDALNLSASAIFIFDIDDTFGLVLGGSASTSYAIEADPLDAISGGGIVAANIQLAEGLRIGLGAAIRVRLEDDLLIVPFINLAWQINDQWRIGIGESGPGLKVSFKSCEITTYILEGLFDVDEYRLGPDAVVPDGIFASYSVRVAIGADLTPFHPIPFTIGIRAGATVFQEHQLQTDSGVGVRYSELDPVPYIALTVGLRWY